MKTRQHYWLVLKKLRIVFWMLMAFVAIFSMAHLVYPMFSQHKVGDKLDEFNGVYVYYNGDVGNTGARHLAPDGYNLGLPYQCVEFVKRYYYEFFQHKMPDSYGHAKDFYDTSIPDGTLSPRRNLIQYNNPSRSAPKMHDIIVFDGTLTNRYGHVAIVTRVDSSSFEIIQQNPGPYGKSRVNIGYRKNNNGLYEIQHDHALGLLRKEETIPIMQTSITER